MENKTPVRSKAARTRQKLLESTIEQTAKYGYHNITADKIAKAAGVSTGCAYRYFKNKKEMLIAAIEYYFENVQEFSNTQDSKLSEFTSMEEMLSYVLDQFYLFHQKYYALHEELESLRHIDPDIREVYNRIMSRAVDALLPKCPSPLDQLPDLRERLYVGLGILENFSHIQMDPFQSSVLNMVQMKQLSIQAAISLISDNR